MARQMYACFDCNGTGEINGSPCVRCAGTGEIPADWIKIGILGRADIVDRLNDIMDKCNDIFEKVNEP